MNDFVDSIKTMIKDRFSSPIVGVYILSFLSINWKVFVILLYNGPLFGQELLNELQKHVTLNSILWYPIFSTLAGILFFPWVSLVTACFWEWSNVLKVNAIKRIKSNIIISGREADDLRRESITLESSYIEAIERKKSELKIANDELEKSRNQVIALNQNAQELNAMILKLQKKDIVLTDEELKVLSYLAENGKHVQANVVANENKMEIGRTNFLLGRLAQKQFLSTDATGYWVTQNGREMVYKRDGEIAI